MTRYQVPSWDTFFENNKSRLIDVKSWTCVPNKQHGMGFTYIMAQADGRAIYGVWCLIVGALSQQRNPRNGWMTHNGAKTGTPWTPAELAVRWRAEEKEILRALQVLSSPNVGWLEAAECPSSAREVPPNGQRMEGEERKDVLEGMQAAPACTEPEIPASMPKADGAAAAVDEVLVKFPVIGRGSKSWELTKRYVAELSEDFPTLDVEQQCRRARSWVSASDGHRKTARGMKQFLVNWLNRAVRNGDTRERAAHGGGGMNGNGFGRQLGAEELDPGDARMIEEMFDGGARK